MAALRLDQARTGAVGAVAGTPEAQVIPRPGRYEIDTSCSAVTFRTRHLFGLAPVRGSFTIRAGTIDVAEPLADSSVHVQIDPASFRTGNGQRDGTVRSERLLDTDRYPVITFRSEERGRSGLDRHADRAQCHHAGHLDDRADRGERAMVHGPGEHAHRPDRVRRDRIPRAGRAVPRHDHGGAVRTHMTSAAIRR